ncbi:MAG: membrane protein insertase YidC [Bacteroidales bacterium]|nr:membrane protein insertase YidC [Bacteroidales bacterium]
MNKQSIIGLVLIFAIFVGYMWWISPSQEELAEMARVRDSVRVADSLQREALRIEAEAALATDSLAEATATDSIATVVAQGSFAPAMNGSNQTIKIANGRFDMQLATRGAMVNSVCLHNYSTYDSLPLQLISPSDNNLDLVFLTTDEKTIHTNELFFTPFVNGEPWTGDSLTVEGSDSMVVSMRAWVDADSADATTTTTTTTGRYLEFVYTIHGDSYEVGFDIHYNHLDQVIAPTPWVDLVWNNHMQRQEKVELSSRGSKNRNKDTERAYTNIYYKPSNSKPDNLRQMRDDQKQLKTPIQWISYKQQFFAAILSADEPFLNANVKLSTDGNDTSRHYLCDMQSQIGVPYVAEADHSTHMNFYFGTTKYRDLHSMHQGFERMLPLGWGFFLIQWVNRYAIIPVFNFLEQFNWNYGIIIIVLTFLMRLVLFPLTFKSYQGSAIMRILKPEMDALNKKYPNPEQAMQKQQQMLALQRRAGYSPMAGCLPMLIQMPILYAMFRFYPASIELRQKPFLWCDDLSTYDSILNFGFNIPLYGDHISLFCLLMFGVQFFYTWYTMRGQNMNAGMPGMKFMMYFMPFMMLFLFNSQSAALNLYYFVSLSLTMLQMILIRRFTSEQKVRARMVAYDAKNNSKSKKKSNFQQRLEALQKQAEQMQREQRKR